MSMKFTAKKLSLAFAIFALLAVAGIVQAQETTQLIISPEPIKTSFGSEFSLQLSQTAFIEEYQITLQETLIKDITCIDGACPAAPAPIAVLTVLQEKGDLNYLVREKIYLNSGAEAEVLGIKIKSLANYPGSVRLVATKPSIPEPVPTPVMLYPKLGEEFKLSLRQQANIQENSQTVMKLILERIEVQEIQCFTTPCDPITYAVLTASLPEAGIENFKVRLNGSSTLGVYEVHFTGVASDASSGKFVVKRISPTPPPEELIVVSLGQEFKFKEGQTAKVRETGLLVELESVKSTIVDCVDCPPSEITPVIRLNVSNPPLKSLAVLELKAGEKATVYGHTIKATGIDVQGKTASLVIVQETTPPIVRSKTVYLNEKFKLSENEKAAVFPYESGCALTDEQIEQGMVCTLPPPIMRIKLLSIGLYACAEQAGSATSTYSTGLRCISGAFARLELSSQSGDTETGTEAMVMEGQSVLFNGYEVSFLDSYISSTEKTGVFLVRKPAYVDYKKVSLDEKFDLHTGKTALVASEGVFIRLEGASEDSAKVFVWQGQADERMLYKQAMPYAIKIGQTLDVYGLQIKLLGTREDIVRATSNPGWWADFIVTKESSPSIINVHINEPFKLVPEQAARVLEANLRIDVSGIGTSCSVYATNAEDSATSSYGPSCFSSVEFSVSNYAFEKGYIGREVDEKVIAATIVSTSTERRASEGITETQDTATEEKIIELPPTPWKTYSLGEGESVEVGDFEIQVLSVTPERAEFKVVKKAGGQSFSYVLKQGWNLFSMPGDLQAESSNCESSNFRLFEYNAAEKKFDKVVNPVAGRAYWLYNSGKSCEAKAVIRQAATLSDIPSLSGGWNFVAIVPEMLGSKITDFGDCELKSAYEWNASSRNWEKVLTRILNNGDLGKALAVNALKACTLSGESAELPPMPSDVL